ncbi:hypothetical protein [Halogeometricum limi]|uniref:Uncharacterized protein n=1 Tax=Halogeometricum limi TaxID=555875 RepID=A0A1I6HCF5_9EURY|nr:hypothetical protein [Halogeometricum limi]SFR52061.1 hypothetical protein SAMN04488124_2047 [Halogeometricum limi]
MLRPPVHRRRGNSLPVYGLFVLGFLAIAGGVVYPTEALLGGSTATSLVSSASPVDGRPLVVGATAVVLGSCALVLAELLFLARG